MNCDCCRGLSRSKKCCLQNHSIFLRKYLNKKNSNIRYYDPSGEKYEFKKLKNVKPDKSGEIQITDAIKLLIEDETVNACIYEGEKFDCGSKLGFVEATIAISLRDKEIGYKVKDLISKL